MSSDSLFREWHVPYTRVPEKLLSDKEGVSFPCFEKLNIFNFIFSIKVTCGFLLTETNEDIFQIDDQEKGLKGSFVTRASPCFKWRVTWNYRPIKRFCSPCDSSWFHIFTENSSSHHAGFFKDLNINWDKFLKTCSASS